MTRASNGWTTALTDATVAIAAAAPADLTPVRSALALVLNACAAARSGDVLEALYWSAVTDAALAVKADLTRLPGDDPADILPAAGGFPPSGPQIAGALRAVCVAIFTGLRRYLEVVAASGRHAFNAVVASRGAQRLVDAVAGR